MIFHSYVSLPEGNYTKKHYTNHLQCPNFHFLDLFSASTHLVYQRVPVVIHEYQDTHPHRRAIPRCQATPAPPLLPGAPSCRGAPPGRPGMCPRFQRWSRWRRPHILLGIFGFLRIFMDFSMGKERKFTSNKGTPVMKTMGKC